MPDAEHLRAVVVLLAAGSGTRVGAATNKVLLPLAGTTVLGCSLRRLRPLRYVDQVVVVHRNQDRLAVEAIVAQEAAGVDVALVVGGATRHASEWNALQVIAGPVEDGEVDVVVIHDSARPLASTRLFDEVIRTAAARGGAIPVRRQPGLLHRDPRAPLPTTDTLVAVQTPQAFRAAPLLTAYRRAEADGFTGTDTASCLEAYTDTEVVAVPSPATNLKITFPEDVALAERLTAAPGQHS